MDEIDGALERWVDEHKAEMLTFFTGLISKKSENPPGEYNLVTKYLKDQYEEWGFSPELFGKPGKPNVLGRYSRNGGPTIILYGHTDTVPAGPGWTYPPFEGIIKDDKVIGRGAYDCKGRVTIYSYATRAVKETNAAEKGRVVLAMTVDEEIGGEDGVKYLLDKGLLKGDLAICEGPDTTLWTAHVGLLQYEITVKGKSTHAGRLYTGDNAITKMMKVMEGLMKTKSYYESLGTKYRNEILRCTTLNIGVIRGGSKVNMVPGDCTIEVDMRVAPEYKIDDVLERVKSDIRSTGVQPEPELKITTREDPEIMPSDMRVFRIIRDVVKDRQGKDVPMVVAHGISDDRWFRRAGIPAMCYGGPGGPETGIGGHGTDEFVRVSDLVEATKNMALVLRRLLNEGV